MASVHNRPRARQPLCTTARRPNGLCALPVRARADQQRITDMDFGDTRRKRSAGGSSDSPGGKQGGSPYKKQVPVPGHMQVEIKCDRFCVGARWQFGAERLKANFVSAKVAGFSDGLVWNIAQKKWINAERNSEPPAIELTCPSQESLRV